MVDTRCLRQGYGSFIRATRLDDDDEVSARLRCGMIVCHRHPTRATGNHADGIELSASATEANAKLEIYPSGNGWFEAGIPVTRFIAQRRTRGVGKQQVVERRETILAGWLVDSTAGRVLARPVETTTRHARKLYRRDGMRLFERSILPASFV
ncbi:PREDICTED: uncharacterized protein LOC105149220 [Acromyrmex echinatior]|uniref:uncharacterized protein LOC105149220 n=1 Tax=Acromyrmex echinatior TaxID=103372 RepID=UPI000580DFD4|nr:PREDICTED: uncharacterized protein LOC105149220 [Acromyrmex echinatior]